METQLKNIAAHPMFSDLRTTLRSECEAQDTVPNALYACIGTTCRPPVTVRSSQLHMKFLQMNHTKSRELHQFYVQQSAQLESERYTALGSSATNVWLLNSVNMTYDDTHHSLLDRVEISLNHLEHTIKQTRVRHTVSSKVDNSSVRVMQFWYDNNIEHPYPSHEEVQTMATAGGISTEQVKKWFYNKRQRCGHTKRIAEIVHRRKRQRTLSNDDIMVEAAKLARIC